jgi:hypothetical protein
LIASWEKYFERGLVMSFGSRIVIAVIVLVFLVSSVQWFFDIKPSTYFSKEFSAKTNPPEKDELGSISRPPKAKVPLDSVSKFGESARIFGKTVNQRGDVVANVQMTIRQVEADGRLEGLSVTVTSAEDGSFSFQNLKEGRYLLNTQATTYYPRLREHLTTSVDPVMLVVVEKDSMVISGRVMDMGGEPVAFADVVPEGGSGESATTNNDGYYQLKLLHSRFQGSYTMIYRRQGYIETRRDFQGLSADQETWVLEDVVLAVPPESVLVRGSLRDENSKPIAFEKIHLFSPSLGKKYMAVSNENGMYQFDGVLEASDYRMKVRPEGPYFDHDESPLEFVGGDVYIKITLGSMEEGSISGRLVDSDGMGIAGMRLQLENDSAINKVIAFKTDSYGYFNVDTVPVGEVFLRKRSPPYINILGIRIAANEEAYIEVELDVGDYELVGRVIGESGFPVSGAEVRLRWSAKEQSENLSSQTQRSVITKSDGVFVFHHLSFSERTLQVTARDFQEGLYIVDENEFDIEIKLLSLNKLVDWD